MGNHGISWKKPEFQGFLVGADGPCSSLVLALNPVDKSVTRESRLERRNRRGRAGEHHRAVHHADTRLLQDPGGQTD